MEVFQKYISIFSIVESGKKTNLLLTLIIVKIVHLYSEKYFIFFKLYFLTFSFM